MAKTNWLDILEWEETQLEDLRSVGYAYIKQGEYDIALSFFQALNVLSNDNVYDIQMLGAIYLQKGKGLEALQYIDKALSLDPNHFSTLLNRGKALFLLGYRRQGLEQMKQLLNCKDKNIASAAEALMITYS